MAVPELTKLWVSEVNGRKEIRASFSNDRHHAVMILPPHSIDQVKDALMRLAQNIERDPQLATRETDKANVEHAQK